MTNNVCKEGIYDYVETFYDQFKNIIVLSDLHRIQTPLSEAGQGVGG